ncbi:hypothetical protein [Streptomyces termitum]|uniref:hypothetical protein n=1 Tax=Streptomyces termitum TaxID=67368 RepID=UPI0033BECC4E
MTEISRADVERLVRIEAKLDDALQRSIEDRANHDRDMTLLKTEAEKTSTRLGSLENWRYAVGAALLMGGASTITLASSITSPTP